MMTVAKLLKLNNLLEDLSNTGITEQEEAAIECVTTLVNRKMDAGLRAREAPLKEEDDA